MTNVAIDECFIQDNRKYKLVAPDGGYGYVIMTSYIIYMIIMATYFQSFGLLYGDFLFELTGDKAYGISLTNTILFTSHTLSGFISHILVHHISIRKIGIAGSTLYFFGALGACFMKNLTQMIFLVSICQGIGTGMIVIAIYSSFFSYFTNKINIMMGISNTILAIGVLLSPYTAEMVIRMSGFRNSLWVTTAMAGATFIAISGLQPVEWHLKKIYIDDVHEIDLAEKNPLNEQIYIPCPIQEPETETLAAPELGCTETIPAKIKEDEKQMSCSRIFDFTLLRNYVYWSVAIGTSSVFFSEFAFTGVMPAILSDIGFEMSDIAIMMVIYFVCDLVGRISYSVLNFFYKTRNRYIYLAGALFTAILRTLFSLHNSYNWRLGTLCIMGFIRGFLQITYGLSVSEEFKEKFASAFSLMMAISGVFSLLIGLLASYAKHMTKNNVFILHILTLTLLMCVILWPIEFIYRRHRTKLYTKCKNGAPS